MPKSLYGIHASVQQKLQDHILTGPVAVRGARPGHVLEVRIHDIRLVQAWGYNANLLAVWAQNASGGIMHKHQLGPLRRALSRYRRFLDEAPVVLAGDFNNNAIWDKLGWRINHMTMVEILRKRGLVSAYHETRREAHGRETVPTIYWRDRTRDGPTYHIDYVFLPSAWLSAVNAFDVGGFDDWCGNGLSDHAPLVVDLSLWRCEG